MLKNTLKTILCLFVVFLFACSWVPVRQDRFEQGNIFSQSEVDKLKVGMTTQQVLFVLGSPVLDSPFQPNRWHYVYLKQVGEKTKQQKKLTLYFQDEKLVKLETV